MKKMYFIMMIVSVNLFVISTSLAGEIHDAVQSGNLKKIKYLIEESKISPNILDSNGNPPIYYALKQDKTAISRYLISNGADLSLHAPTEKIPLLLILLESGMPDLLALAYKNGADPDMIFPPHYIDGVPFVGVNALHVVSAINYGDDKGRSLDLAKIIIKHGGDPNVHSPTTLETPLHLAIANGKHGIVELLLKNGANPNFKMYYGATPLHLVVEYGQNDSLKHLIEHGANVNGQDYGGNTPLHLAVYYLSKEFSLELIKHGARQDIQNRHMKTPRDYVYENNIWTIKPFFSRKAK